MQISSMSPITYAKPFDLLWGGSRAQSPEFTMPAPELSETWPLVLGRMIAYHQSQDWSSFDAGNNIVAIALMLIRNKANIRAAYNNNRSHIVVEQIIKRIDDIAQMNHADPHYSFKWLVKNNLILRSIIKK